MKIQVYQDLHELSEIADMWNELVRVCASHVPFLRYEYLTTWWEFKGGGEWETGKLYVITAQSETGDLTGIAPLFLTQNLDGKKALMFLGSFEISDYLDVIVRPEDLDAFVEALLKHLTSSEAPAWEVLDFYNLLDDSPTLNALKDAAKNLDLHYTQETIQPSPYVMLPDDWDTYLAGLKKKQRHEIRRKIRRAETAETGLRWYIVEDETTLDGEVDAFLQLMSHDHLPDIPSCFRIDPVKIDTGWQT